MRSKYLKFGALAISAAAVLLIGIFSSYILWEKAPEIEVSPSAAPTALHSPTPTEDAGLAFDTNRQDGVYTLLLVGNDDGNGNTDTILVGKLDTKAHSMDFVNIPRDTLINENWNIRKINAVYWSDVNSGGNGIDALRYQLKRLLGFDVDCYAVVDLNVFVDVVDAMGGVYFDVPQALDYEDPWQDLYIHIQPGYQLLDGYSAMGVCRYRSGYIDGDLGRINMQQQFLKACASQFTELGSIPNLSKVVSLLAENVDTNMSSKNIAFFIRQALQCKEENINFHTAPNSSDIVNGYSYAIIDLWTWLPMINELLNPFETQVGFENLDIVYKDGGSFLSTGILHGADYYLPPPATVTEPVAEPEPETEAEPAPEFDLPEPVLPAPESPVATEAPLPEMEVPDSIGNIIIDF